MSVEIAEEMKNVRARVPGDAHNNLIQYQNKLSVKLKRRVTLEEALIEILRKAKL